MTLYVFFGRRAVLDGVSIGLSRPSMIVSLLDGCKSIQTDWKSGEGMEVAD